MPDFGPFSSFSDALMAACPLILEKPHATAGSPSAQDFRLRWQLSKEYCAWLYYTPAHQYEMSMLATDAVQGDSRKRSCALPPVVDDRRYPPDSLGYLFVLHNHPFEDTISDPDIRYIVSMAAIHGLEVKTRTGSVPLSIVAFFSGSNDVERPTCGGFFQYVPKTGDVLKWTTTHPGRWQRRQTATVTWTSETSYRIDRK
ncbi:hypothetical protein ACLESO_44285 [Pyxidicoccus sp. 3LG]